MDRRADDDWVDHLDSGELMFVKRLVLASGSLKQVAREYGISYPTVRLRLDRLIAKIRVLEDRRIEDPLERLLRTKYAEGKLDEQSLRELLAAYRDQRGDVP